MATKAIKPTKFSKTLKALRLQSSLTPEQLGERAGIHPMVVRKLEDGQNRCPRLDTAKRLAEALGVSLDQLAEGV